MSLITANKLSKSYGPVDIFKSLDFAVPHGSRLALVGPNGIGKTTLLRILAGIEEPSDGKVLKAKNLNIGYLAQEAEFEMTGTVWEACNSVFKYLEDRQDELNRLENLMASQVQTEQVMNKYGHLQQEFELLGGYTYTTRINQVLTGLGFSRRDFHLQVEHLSGGQRTRAFLAQLLLSNPDVLLLDEPTNHLDISAVEWLEGYLSQWDGAAVIVSHDRYFLNKVANGILEMTAIGTESYKGNYSDYVSQRADRWERRQEIFQSEKEKLLKDVEYIKKNIAGQNTLQAKGKLKRLSRIVEAIEQVGMEMVVNKSWSQVSRDVTTSISPFGVEEAEKRVRALHLPDYHPPKLHLRMQSWQRSGNLVIRTKDLVVGYPGKVLFKAPDIELRRGECAALIGPNGAGKTTFLKTCLGQIKPLSGEVIMGASLQIGYFAQAHEGLIAGNTLIQEIQTVDPKLLPYDVRNYLGRYLFSGDDVYKKVEVLSGGERGRLALAKLALQETNLLLLDEPTNHLDIISQEILENVLQEYKGTILLITHDRYLIDALGTQIWEVEIDESTLSVFNGTYSLRREERERLAALREAEQEQADNNYNKMVKRNRSSIRNNKEERRRTAQIQELENTIRDLEFELAEIGGKLENPPADTALVRKWGNLYSDIQKKMDEKLSEWENLQAADMPE
ncbi:MAG TPA: ABC-F family ATP-binding cassette domain-containing protein [Anaerolineales bacterium]|nr:ABC-F family ATP-binding cassette domain-containing protein [Anaerolineales bacterium]